MVSATEMAGQQSTLEAAIRAGVESIDRSQQITFTRYVRLVLPLDGFVFWVKATLLGPSSVLNASSFNSVTLNQPASIISQANEIVVSGSLHYASETKQNEDETFSKNRVIFTAEQEIQDLNVVNPNSMYLGCFEGIEFMFSSRGSFYRQADIHHYVGDAVYPALKTQIIRQAEELNTRAVIVTNSLPIWLAQNQFGLVYPSFLVPDNLEPPYVVAHIEPDETEFLQAFPNYSQGVTVNPNPPPTYLPGTLIPNSGISPLYYRPSSQLMRDKVRLTLYGFNNQQALQYLVSLIEFSRNTDVFGFMNSPVIRDDKRTQVEMAVIAQKKHIDITASYYQSAADVIAQRLILSAAATTVISPAPF